MKRLMLAISLIPSLAFAQPAPQSPPDPGMTAAMSTAAQGMLAESLQRELAWRARAAGLEAELAKARAEAAKPPQEALQAAPGPAPGPATGPVPGTAAEHH